jgi:hypothetical protein
MGRRFIQFMNFLTRLRRARCRPEELLVLVPSCLQRSGCREKITNDIRECRRCGRCKVKDMLELTERYGTMCAVATGGRLAVEMARKSDVKAVVAIACEKELGAGMRAVFPKPGIGIVNIRPYGPCRDTDVVVADVEEAIRGLVGR